MENNEAINFIKQAFDLKEQKYYKPAIEMLYKALEIENAKAAAKLGIPADVMKSMNNRNFTPMYLAQ